MRGEAPAFFVRGVHAFVPLCIYMEHEDEEGNAN